MPETLNKNREMPIIGGVFPDTSKAQEAYNELTRKQGYDSLDVPMYVHPKSEQQAHDYRAELVSRGVAPSQAAS